MTDTKLNLDVLGRIAKRGSTITPSDTLALLTRIRDLERAQQSAVPDGYVLVPKEPTTDMLVAGINANIPQANCDMGTAMGKSYRAMLPAAPATQHTETK